MYLINFFCGFFVKLSSALAPPARRKGGTTLLFLMLSLKNNNVVPGKYTPGGQNYVYIYIKAVLAEHSLQYVGFKLKFNTIQLIPFEKYVV